MLDHVQQTREGGLEQSGLCRADRRGAAHGPAHDRDHRHHGPGVQHRHHQQGVLAADGRVEQAAITGDTSDERDVAAAVRRVVDTWGRLDNVIANAGFSLPGNLESHAPEDMRAMVLTNVLGPALLVRETLPQLRESKGRIVLMGSVAGVRHTPGNLYSVTKWAVHALAENTRLLVGQDGVGVTVVAPGVVDTPFWDERGGSPETALTAEQIADTIVFALNQPAGVDINHITMRPTGQLG
ncbi:SDR family oxidoreductase [Streptomyces sp. NBC_00503]|uniref:SDR family oxidoreductase n=1 Tax=Streptomyces sp. NBC_00503 TaxID=2903659 RepID=UPI002E818FCC|nr:SDR family NAD(P)-dependent oxidoreductase [Streptomyces sp. NBC_00503]WUD85529.1 SDR family NAD(P)-dependent oxidoreductase [Streptomyces sp. NBC_00503]